MSKCEDILKEHGFKSSVSPVEFCWTDFYRIKQGIDMAMSELMMTVDRLRESGALKVVDMSGSPVIFLGKSKRIIKRKVKRK